MNEVSDVEADKDRPGQKKQHMKEGVHQAKEGDAEKDETEHKGR
jgi:hypothetical protein